MNQDKRQTPFSLVALEELEAEGYTIRAFCMHSGISTGVAYGCIYSR